MNKIIKLFLIAIFFTLILNNTILYTDEPLPPGKNIPSRCMLEASREPDQPFLNKKIINFVNSVMGKKVNRGQCWDLAAVPLLKYNAKWNGYYKFGIELDPEKDKIFPGDIIQFHSVQIVSKRPRSSMSLMTFGYPRHTAIIYKVLGKRHYEIAHQNFSKKRYVMLHKIDLNDITKGSYEIFRPVINFITDSR